MCVSVGVGVYVTHPLVVDVGQDASHQLYQEDYQQAGEILGCWRETWEKISREHKTKTQHHQLLIPLATSH